MANKGIQVYSVSEWERMEREITDLKADLAKFGGHTADCAKIVAKPGAHWLVKCDCGWAALAKHRSKR